MTRLTLIASLAAAIATGAFAVPAFAGGTMTYTYVPQTQQEADSLSSTLRVYSMYQSGHLNGGVITQNGSGNAAGLAQNGPGNLGVIYQDGSNHTATLKQNGSNNTYGVFQIGNGGTVNAVQNGSGKVGITVQAGW